MKIIESAGGTGKEFFYSHKEVRMMFENHKSYRRRYLNYYLWGFKQESSLYSLFYYWNYFDVNFKEMIMTQNVNCFAPQKVSYRNIACINNDFNEFHFKTGVDWFYLYNI